MKRIGTLATLALVGIAPVAFAQTKSQPAAPAPAAADQMLTQEGVIKGTMDIEFGTRANKDSSGDLKPGSAALGAKDKYSFDLTVVNTTQFTGWVSRQPNLYSKTLGRKKQEAQLFYSIDLSVLNPSDPKQKKTVGKWVGTVPIDPTSGAYELSGGSEKESALRIQVDAVGKAAAFQEKFGGRLIGKAEKKESLAEYTFKRVVGNRTITQVVKKADPMKFENLLIATGPAQTYPRTIVNGRLDYDYETGNWYTDNIRFKYTLDGREVEDVVNGSIKWVEDPDRASNGKGYYEFNLRFNETGKATGEAAAFEKMSDEEAFFAVDNSVSALTGRINYVDTFGAGGADAGPISTKVTYAINANKLTKQQVMNFFKLWMVAIGPTNDE